MSEAAAEALVAFENVKLGDKRGYRRALKLATDTVADTIEQLAMVDSILAARKRAYSEVV